MKSGCRPCGHRSVRSRRCQRPWQCRWPRAANRDVRSSSPCPVHRWPKCLRMAVTSQEMHNRCPSRSRLNDSRASQALRDLVTSKSTTYGFAVVLFSLLSSLLGKYLRFCRMSYESFMERTGENVTGSSSAVSLWILSWGLLLHRCP